MDCISKDILSPSRVGLAFVSLFLLISIAFPLTATQRGALTIPQNLPELVSEAATIVRGHVVSTRVEPHPEFSNLDTVVVTLKVEETLKGQTGETFTFRQYLWDIRDRKGGGGYRKGQHRLLLMIEPSQYGLSSPAGLEQGSFRIIRDSQGKEYAINGRGNAALFRNMRSWMAKKQIELSPQLSTLVEEHRTGPVPLGQLEEIIRRLAETN